MRVNMYFISDIFIMGINSDFTFSVCTVLHLERDSRKRMKRNKIDFALENLMKFFICMLPDLTSRYRHSQSEETTYGEHNIRTFVTHGHLYIRGKQQWNHLENNVPLISIPTTSKRDIYVWGIFIGKSRSKVVLEVIRVLNKWRNQSWSYFWVG